MRLRLTLIIICFALLIGCTRGKVKKDYVGKWIPDNVEVTFNSEGYYVDEFIQPILVEAQETIYVFHDDGTVEMQLVDAVKTGKWKYYNYSNANREILALLFKGEKEIVLPIVSYNEKELVLKSEFATGYFTITLVKR